MSSFQKGFTFDGFLVSSSFEDIKSLPKQKQLQMAYANWHSFYCKHILKNWFVALNMLEYKIFGC